MEFLARVKNESNLLPVTVAVSECRSQLCLEKSVSKSMKATWLHWRKNWSVYLDEFFLFLNLDF